MHIVYLATADARGHLMRAQLLVHALREAGASVDVLTTSDAGQRFLARFGIAASVLSRHYAVQFDTRQNMLRGRTNWNVAAYVFLPTRLLRDVIRLRHAVRGAALVINDSFHPALLVMGTMPAWRHKIVHVYGGSLKRALARNFDGVLPHALARAFERVVNWQLASSRACIEHDFAYDAGGGAQASPYRLPTPVPVIPAALDGEASAVETTPPCEAAVYLNPHFCDRSLAAALVAGLGDAGLQAHKVGEGYAGCDGWRGVDEAWAERAARSALIVSAPGMAALSIALVYGRPIVLLVTDQPEQRTNAEKAILMNLAHRVVRWRGDADAFRREVAHAAAALTDAPASVQRIEAGRQGARERVEAWTAALLALAEAQPVQAVWRPTAEGTR
jgi:hypothetical protein